ncbi:MAG: hypothetical protein N4A47_01995 [Clostridia bacterium]|jgi:hypothetical protein|nr:hypothetical protein [Clostridia bacterium]
MGSSFTLRLKKEVKNNSTRISEVLREGYIVAQRMNDVSALNWIKSELRGYGSISDVPEYRKLNGKIHIFDFHKGYVPVNISDRELKVCKSVPLSVKELEEFVYLKPDKFMVLKCPRLERQLKNGVILVEKDEVEKSLKHIRSKFLSWVEDLEEKDILMTVV